MPEQDADTGRFGGPGSSHQDRAHPRRNRQPTGHKGGGGGRDAPPPDAPTNPDVSRVSGGGGEEDRHHRHTPERS